MSRPKTCTLKTVITQITCQQKTQDPDPRRMVPRLQCQTRPAFPVNLSGKHTCWKQGKTGNGQHPAFICGEQSKQDSEVKDTGWCLLRKMTDLSRNHFAVPSQELVLRAWQQHPIPLCQAQGILARPRGLWELVIKNIQVSECQRINSAAEWVWVHKINLLKDSVNKYLLLFHKISLWTFSHWFLCWSNFPLLHKWTVILVEDHIIIPQQIEGQRCSWLALILAFLPRYGTVTNSVAIYLQVHRW